MEIPKSVTIKRKMTGTKQQPDKVRQNATVKLASIYKGGRPIHGFTDREEVEAIMPRVIDADPNDPKFYDKVSKFWNEFSENIPHDGKTLDLQLRGDGQPFNAKDYCTYKFAKVHPLVAENKEEAETYRYKRFWIENPEKLKNKRINDTENESLAWTKFIEIKENEDEVNRLLRVFGGVQPENFASLGEKTTELKDRMQNDFTGFVNAVEDDDLKMQDFVLQCLEEGVLRKVGNSFMYMDEEIGVGMEEVVVYLKSKRNSSVLSTLKAKLKEAKG